MSTVQATNDGYCLSEDNTNIVTARNQAAADSSGTNILYTIYRKAPTPYQVARSFLTFDLSGESGTVDSASIYLYGNSSNANTNSYTFAFYEASNYGTIDTGDNDAFPFHAASGAYTTTGYKWSGDFDETDWSSSAFTEYALNSTAITAINNAVGSGSIYVILLNSADIAETANPVNGMIIDWYCSADSGKEPYIDLTFSGYANTVNTVTSGNIGNINTVATANVDKVNTV